MKTTTRRLLAQTVTVATLACAITVAKSARAESWLLDAEAGAATGLEGGDPGSGSLEWQRARTRVLAGLEMRFDETEDEGTAFRVFAEIEKRGSVGAEARYVRWVTPAVGVYAGALGTFTPKTLIGGGVGVRALVPLGEQTSVFIEPSFNALPLGNDRPDGTVVMWALLSAGVRLGL